MLEKRKVAPSSGKGFTLYSIGNSGRSHTFGTYTEGM